MNTKFSYSAGKKSRLSRGFTLFEMILVIVVMGITAAAGWPVINNVIQTMLIYDQSVFVGSEGTWAMDRLSKELRQASRTGLVISTPGEITFKSAATNDGLVRYYLKDNGWLDCDGRPDCIPVKDLMRHVSGTNGSGEILARSVKDLEFFYDTADANTINYVQFQLTVNADMPGSGTGAVYYPLRSKIYPRTF